MPSRRSTGRARASSSSTTPCTNKDETYAVPGATATSIPVPEDYTGSGHVDPAVYTQSTGTWLYLTPTSERLLLDGDEASIRGHLPRRSAARPVFLPAALIPAAARAPPVGPAAASRTGFPADRVAADSSGIAAAVVAAASSNASPPDRASGLGIEQLAHRRLGDPRRVELDRQDQQPAERGDQHHHQLLTNTVTKAPAQSNPERRRPLLARPGRSTASSSEPRGALPSQTPDAPPRQSQARRGVAVSAAGDRREPLRATRGPRVPSCDRAGRRPPLDRRGTHAPNDRD